MHDYFQFLDGMSQVAITGPLSEVENLVVVLEENLVGEHYISSIDHFWNCVTVYVRVKEDRDMIFLKLACQE